MKSFRDPTTNILKACGFVEANNADIGRIEPDDFNLKPGEWQLVNDVWQPYIDHNGPVQAQIDDIERLTLMNRGCREGWIALIVTQAAAQGITQQELLDPATGNPFFRKLIETDNTVRALRDQLT